MRAVFLSGGSLTSIAFSKPFPRIDETILDFDKDIYGERIEVEFKHKIRDEKKFTSLDNLVQNIQNDINKIRAWFHQANNN